MLETLLFAYFAIIPTFLITCIVCILYLDVHILPQIYINILDPIMSVGFFEPKICFQYTARQMGRRCTSTVNLKQSRVDEDDPTGDYVDGNLIERDVTLCEDRIHMSGDYVIEDKEFKLHHTLYLIRSGVEVSFPILSSF